MWPFSLACDDCYVSARLAFKLELQPDRETLLHFFEQVRRQHPELSRLRRRENGGVVLDAAAPGEGGRPFLKLESSNFKFGVHQATDGAKLRTLGDTVLELAPPALSLSDLDYDHYEIVFGFNLLYRGNHDELVADVFFSDHPLVAALAGPQRRVIDFQPFCGVALNDDCDLQAYVEIKSRTSAYEVRCGTFDDASLTVLLTLRRYWGCETPDNLKDVHNTIVTVGEELAASRIAPQIVQPLADAIASRR